jgi:hypothetical protein
MKIRCFLVIFFIGALQAENAFEIPTFTEHVYKRYYFIARLEKTMEFFVFLKEHNYFSIDTACIKKIYAYKYYFVHEVITKTIDNLVASNSIEPLFETWFEFRSYKYLYDEIFLQEFTKLILLFSERILSHTMQHQEEPFFNSGKIQAMLESGFRAPEVEQLEYIDFIIDFLQKIILKNKSIFTKLSIWRGYLKKNYTQAVSQRLYFLNRLQKPVSLILEFYKKPTVCFQTIRACSLIFDNKATFSHERINLCIVAMEKECSLEPFVELWHDFKHYKYLDDDLFIKEFSKAIFILEKNIIINGLAFEPIKRNSFDFLLGLYEKIDALPLEEILNAIDLLAHELPLISQKYELETDMTWKQWFKKYWWAPPLILGTIGLKFLLTVKNIKIVMNLLKPNSEHDYLENLEVENNETTFESYSSDPSTRIS